MDLADLDLGLLLALDALLEDHNVTRAAVRLGISQPALSARLSRLREAFTDPLFVPATSGRGVVPTLRATGLQVELAGILSRLRGLMEGPAPFDPAQTRRTFVVATGENPAAILAPGLISRVTAAAPGARMAFEDPGPDVLDRLERGAVDLLVAGSDRAGGDLMRRPLFEDGFLTAQRGGHPRGRQPLDLDTFCALDHLLVSADGGGFHGLVDDALEAIGRTRRVAVSIQSYALAPLILSASDCVCTLPRRFFGRFASELDLFLPPVELRATRLLALWHPRSQQDQGHAWFREQLYAAADQARPARGTFDRRDGTGGLAARDASLQPIRRGTD
jgi:DNA-binding transcriptional LysR family regulator